MPKVLISDKMDPRAAAIFQERGVDVDVITGTTPEELMAIIGDYDGLAIRSSTKVTKEILDAATNLKVIGRAGIGVDNVDIPYASAKGVIVMNTPFGNSITTAEHAIALMFALARQLPEANAQTQAGLWPKNGFMGVEVTGKTLGLIGAGNIGSIVATRALGLKMKVVAFDPFLTPERAVEMGVEKADLDTLLAKADFITLHTPLTDQTRNILSRENLAKTKQGVRIVNCARGGLIDEAALKETVLSDPTMSKASLSVGHNAPLWWLGSVNKTAAFQALEASPVGHWRVRKDTSTADTLCLCFVSSESYRKHDIEERVIRQVAGKFQLHLTDADRKRLSEGKSDSAAVKPTKYAALSDLLADSAKYFSLVPQLSQRCSVARICERF